MHPLLQGVEFDEISRSRLGFFMGIEELQLTYAACIFKTFRPDIFLDVGANIGAYSLVLKNIVPDTQVIAIEASEATFDILVGNVRANSDGSSEASQVEALNYAATRVAATMQFADFGNASGKSGVAASSIHEIKDAELVAVEGKPIDQLIQPDGKMIFLKFDTEGHEYDAIAGARTLLSKNQCIVQAELGHGRDSGKEVKALLSELGYRELFLIGPDQYFISEQLAFDDAAKLALHEQAILTFGLQRWGKKCPWLYSYEFQKAGLVG